MLGSFGNYELLEKLGEGGMAEVFLARSAGLAGFTKKLVLKRVLPNLESDDTHIEMFLDEARLAARLEHPNICQVFDLGRTADRYYIVMEHVPGVTFAQLAAHFAKKGIGVPLEVTLRVISQLLEALEYAHALRDENGRDLNLVHRDVTPSNVMVTPQGSVKLLDFGIARASTRKQHTQVGMTRGKVGYMSPEQCRAEPLDKRSDLFAVGTVLYVAATGQLPYGSGPMSTETYEDMVFARFPTPRTVNPDVPNVIEAVILKAMAAEPRHRFARAFDMLQALEKASSTLGVSLGPNALSQVVQRLQSNEQEAHTAMDSPVLAATRLNATAPPPPLLTRRIQRASSATRGPLVVEANAPVAQPHPAPAVAKPRVRNVRSAVALSALLASAIATTVWWLARPAITAPPVETTEEPPKTVETAELVPNEPEIPPPLVAELVPEVPKLATIEPKPRIPEPAKPPARPPRPADIKRAEAEVPTPTGPTGVLSISSTPSAEVRFKKRLMGKTPLVFVLPEGTQRVELRYPGQPPRTMLVNIVAGQRTPLTDSQ